MYVSVINNPFSFKSQLFWKCINDKLGGRFNCDSLDTQLMTENYYR